MATFLTGRRGLVVMLAALAVAAVAAVFAWRTLRRPSAPAEDDFTDPRIAYTGPFRNISPAVGYVAESRCAACHREIASDYSHHAMGHSLYPIDSAPTLPIDKEHHNPFTALGSRFHVERDGKMMRQRRVLDGKDGRPLIEQEWGIDYVLGSGGRGHSFLTNRDGFVLQTPVSWYSQKQRWDLSPGFSAVHGGGRTVLPDCLFCHVNRANHVEHSIARYDEPVFNGHAIGCQRCHGPGELHVTGRPGGDRVESDDKVDPTIVNPRHLSPALRDAVCEQCHLQGETRVPHHGLDFDDFRPGLPAERFWSVLLRAPEPGKGAKAISHVEQMHASQCYQKSQGQERLSCVSCHDPHRRIGAAERVGFYRERCLSCHAERGCVAPAPARQAKKDSCIDCHMPRYGASDIPHTASTDHRVLRHGKPRPSARIVAEQGAGPPLVSYYHGRDGITPEIEDRALALGMIRLAQTGVEYALEAVPQTLNLLETAQKRAPGDLAVLEARGYALGRRNRPSDALAAFETALEKRPKREAALIGAAAMAEALGKTELALDYWRRAVSANPVAPAYRRGLAQLLMRRAHWEEAGREADAWVRLDPFDVKARAARLICLLQADDLDEARLEMARVEALAPPNLPELRLRFETKMRGR
jgi:Flp pilus assembly protein TadD